MSSDLDDLENLNDLDSVTAPRDLVANGAQRPAANNQAAVLNADVQALIDEFANPQTEFKRKIELAVNLQTQMLPVLLKEASANRPSVPRSVVAARLGILVRDTVKMLQDLRDQENRDEVDLNHPKIQTAFGWFLQLFEDVLIIEKIDPLTRKSVFMTLQSKLVGWEERANKSLGGLSAKAMASTENPFGEILERTDYEIELDGQPKRDTDEPSLFDTNEDRDE